MNAGEWLHSRTPRPPVALTGRLDVLLAHADRSPATSVESALGLAGDQLLADLLQSKASSRESALDLLAADALMTYMMEAAAERVDTLGSVADDAMRRISAILDQCPAST